MTLSILYVRLPVPVIHEVLCPLRTPRWVKRWVPLNTALRPQSPVCQCGVCEWLQGREVYWSPPTHIFLLQLNLSRQSKWLFRLTLSCQLDLSSQVKFPSWLRWLLRLNCSQAWHATHNGVEFPGQTLSCPSQLFQVRFVDLAEFYECLVQWLELGSNDSICLSTVCILLPVQDAENGSKKEQVRSLSTIYVCSRL